MAGRGNPTRRPRPPTERLLQYLSPRERMFALVALGVAAQQHETRRRRHQEATATHGAAATDDDHELWLRSSGAVNADGKGLLRRKEARFVEDWWCARAGNEEIYACRARRTPAHSQRDQPDAAPRAAAGPASPTDRRTGA